MQTQAAALTPVTPFTETLAGKATLALAGSLFVAACAHLSVPLPFTPVPLTLSDLAVLIVGLSLTPSVAFSALMLYLVEGASGLPVFSASGPGGVAQLFAWATSGYLLSYPFAAFTASALARGLGRVTRSPFVAGLCAAAVASTLIMLAGFTWLSFFLHLRPAAAFVQSVVPFLPGQIIKICAAAGIVTSARRLGRV